MALTQYKQKRNFDNTPEPKGKIKAKKSQKLLYVIQKHAASHLHYDFRLELNGVLLSWAVPKGPCLDPTVKRLAMHVEDHPIEYGSFEGIIPKGQYGGGTVMLWDKGEWISEDENPQHAFRKGSMKFSLKGEKLHGKWKLIRTNNNDKTWLLIKIKDEFSENIGKYDILADLPNSILTGQTLQDIANQHGISPIKNKLKSSNKKKSALPRKNKKILPKLNSKLIASAMPKAFKPQLATLVDQPPEGVYWLHEIKFDGYRIIAIKQNGKTRLMSRNNLDWTSKFKDIAESINDFPIENVIFDGEVVVLDENQKSNFQSLQNAIKGNVSDPFYYYIFDLPYYGQYSFTELTLLERKNYLAKVLKNFPSDRLRYSDHLDGSGEEILHKSCELNLEGIVSKDSRSPYISKRTKAWLKSKCVKRQEFVIGGYTNPKGARNNFGALLIGTYNEQGELLYHGNVGTGFTKESLNSLHKLLKKNHSTNNPFTTKPPKIKQITWVKPTLIAEVEFTEWTNDGNLRHPSFQGLRLDKNPKKVIKEKPLPIEEIQDSSNTYTTKNTISALTHPNKIFYPEDGLTKQDIAEYYAKIQKWILPYVINRPLTLLRCPEGYKKCFYQKHIGDAASAALHRIKIRDKKNIAEYFYIKDAAGLFYFSQLGVLEIHPWGSGIKNIEYPDIIVFDLDPAPGISWEKVVKAAKQIKTCLSKFKLKSFVKSTGGKGLHVVVPIKPEHGWEEIKQFSQAIVDFLEMDSPKEYTGNLSKLKRKGKIFIDYLRNQRGATAVAPFSTRARLHAPVSTPLTWEELTDRFEDTYFTIKTLPERLEKLKKDPWKDFFKIQQSLKLKK